MCLGWRGGFIWLFFLNTVVVLFRKDIFLWLFVEFANTVIVFIVEGILLQLNLLVCEYGCSRCSGNELQGIAASGLETVSRHGFAAPWVLTVPKSSAAVRPRYALCVLFNFFLVSLYPKEPNYGAGEYCYGADYPEDYIGGGDC